MLSTDRNAFLTLWTHIQEGFCSYYVFWYCDKNVIFHWRDPVNCGIVKNLGAYYFLDQKMATIQCEVAVDLET